MLKMTDVAKDQVKKVLSDNPGKVLHIVVAGFGWGGPRLGLVLGEPDSNGVATTVDGAEIFIPSNLEGLAEMSTLDYWPLDGFSFEPSENVYC